MLFSNFLQIISSLYYIFFPHFNKTTPLITSSSVLLAWISLGYFLDFENQYSNFYIILKRSLKMHLKYLLLFLFFFLGFTFMAMIIFSYSEPYYSSFSQSSRTLFSCLFGDTILDIMFHSLKIDTFKTITFYVIYLVLSICFAMKVLVSVTEEAFDSVKFKSNFYWLDKKLSIDDYLQYEINNEDNEDINPHYMLSDVLMNLVINENEENLNKLDQILVLDEEKVVASGYDLEKVRGLYKKHFKKIHKETISNEIMRNLIDHDFFSDPYGISLRLGITETLKVKDVYEYADSVFHQIGRTLDKINNIVKANIINSYMKEKIENFVFITNRSLKKLKLNLN
jgi:hypothetical protein